MVDVRQTGSSPLAVGKHGGAVAVAGRRQRALEDLCAEIGPTGLAVPCDVRKPADCDMAVQRAVAGLGGLDALVYAAGVSKLLPLSQADAEFWHDVIETNVIGASLVCRAALPHLRSSGGRAVFLGSSSVGRPFPGLVAYAASKAALDELVRGWRAENPDLSFSTVVVGPTDGTEFHAQWDPDLAAEMFPYWERNGYLSSDASMEVADVSQIVCSVLTAPASMWTVAVYAHNPLAARAIS